MDVLDSMATKQESVAMDVQFLMKNSVPSPSTTRTPAKVGFHEFQRLQNASFKAITFFEPIGGDAVCEVEPLAAATKESRLCSFLAEPLSQAVDGKYVVLVNSESHQWLRDSTDAVHLARFDKKPDFFVAPLAVVKPISDGVVNGVDGHFYGIPLQEWVELDGITAVIEAKQNIPLPKDLSEESVSFEALGEMVDYIRLLNLGDLVRGHGILVCKTHFWVCYVQGKLIERIEIVPWDAGGSLQLLRECFQYSVGSWSWLLVESMKTMKMAMEPNSFLGRGAMGCVFKCGKQAIKIVRSKKDGFILEREFKNLKSINEGLGQTDIRFVLNSEASKFSFLMSDDNDIVGACMTMPHGEKLRPPLGEKPLRAVCVALFRFHDSGWRHGDPRLANVVRAYKSWCWIDVAHSTQLSPDAKDAKGARFHDICCLSRSVLSLSRAEILPESLKCAVDNYSESPSVDTAEAVGIALSCNSPAPVDEKADT